METPKRPTLTTKIELEALYQALHDILEEEHHKTFLQNIYGKAVNLETVRNELEGRNSRMKEHNDQMQKLLHDWRTGKENFLSGEFTSEERDNLIDVFHQMLDEYNSDYDHIDFAISRLKSTLSIHENACEALANFMADLIDIVSRKLVPDNDFVYLDTSNLSMQEKVKLEELIASGRDERIEINDEAIAFNLNHIHTEGNQVLIDPKMLDPRERKALSRTLDPDNRNDASIGIPVRALVQVGEDVDEENIQRVSSFPEENPDRDVEEADEEMYGEESSTSNEEDPDDELPF